MKEEELIDDNIYPEKGGNISLALAWWEKKRILFNVLVGFSGTIGILMNLSLFHTNDIILIIFYGLFANLMFSMGFLLEVFDDYYFKSKLKLQSFRLVLFLIGSIFSCIITFVMAVMFYTFNI